MSRMVVGLSLGVLFLAVALFVPQLIDVTQERATATFELDNQTERNVTEVLAVGATSLNGTEDSANLTATNLRTLESNQTELNSSETESLDVGGETVDLTLDSLADSDTAQITTVYSPRFGWDRPASLFWRNVDVVFAILGFATIIGGLWGGIKDI